MKLKKAYKAMYNAGVNPVEDVLNGKEIENAEILMEKAEGDSDPKESVKVEFHSKDEKFGITAWCQMSHLMALGLFTQDAEKNVTFHKGTFVKGNYVVKEPVTA